MSYILFCNSPKCSKLYESNRRLSFFVTSCSHTFCGNCISKDKFCHVCKKTCRIMEIDEKMPADVARLFQPNIIPKMRSSIKQIQRFQESQAKQFDDHALQLIEDYKQIKRDIVKITKKNDQIKAGINQEKMLIRKLKEAHKSKVVDHRLFQSPTLPVAVSPKSRTPDSANRRVSALALISNGRKVTPESANRRNIAAGRSSQC